MEYLSPGLFRLDLIREGHREGATQRGPGDPTYHSWPCRSGCLAVTSSLPRNHTGRSHLCWCRAGCRCHTWNTHQSLPGKGQGFPCDGVGKWVFGWRGRSVFCQALLVVGVSISTAPQEDYLAEYFTRNVLSPNKSRLGIFPRGREN